MAIARALITDPAVIFADEPTGALDTRSAREVLDQLGAAVRDFGRCSRGRRYQEPAVGPADPPRLRRYFSNSLAISSPVSG